MIRKSGAGIDVPKANPSERTKADREHTASVFMFLWKNVYWRRPRLTVSACECIHMSGCFPIPINTQNKMSAVCSDGAMISTRSLWTSQSPQIHSLAVSWCGRDLVTMGMRRTVLSAQWLSGTGDCVMEGWTGRQQDETCPPLLSEAEFAIYDISFDMLCVIVHENAVSWVFGNTYFKDRCAGWASSWSNFENT